VFVGCRPSAIDGAGTVALTGHINSQEDQQAQPELLEQAQLDQPVLLGQLVQLVLPEPLVLPGQREQLVLQVRLVLQDQQVRSHSPQSLYGDWDRKIKI